MTQELLDQFNKLVKVKVVSFQAEHAEQYAQQQLDAGEITYATWKKAHNDKNTTLAEYQKEKDIFDTLVETTLLNI